MTWGSDAATLTQAERDEIVERLRKAAAAHHDAHEAAAKSLEGTGFVAVPVDHLSSIYRALKRLTRLGQASIEERSSLPKEVADLKHAIFREADFAALYAGQWLPQDERTKVLKETTKFVQGKPKEAQS